MAAQGEGGIGPLLGTFMVAGTMIGSGVFLLPASIAAIGSISILGWLAAAAGALLVGLTLAALARLVPQGGFVAAIDQTLGAFPARLAALLYLLGVILSISAVAVALAGAIGFLWPALAAQPASSLVAILCIALFTALNQSRGPRIARIASITLVIGLFPILLVGLYGWVDFSPSLFRAGWNRTGGPDTAAVLQATLLVFWAFLGLEVASVVSRRMADPARNVPIATIAGVLLAALVYISASAAIMGLVPADALQASTAPFALAALGMLGPAAATVVAVCAGLKAAGTLGALQMSATECWLSTQRLLGRDALGPTSANLLIGAVAALIVWLSASPTLAGQYAIIIGAVVALSFLAFALAGIGLARRGRGPARLVGAAAALFTLGLLAAQPPEILLPALATAAGTALLVALATRRRPAAA
jgi:arginine:agmatine antiporter